MSVNIFSWQYLFSVNKYYLVSGLVMFKTNYCNSTWMIYKNK